VTGGARRRVVASATLALAVTWGVTGCAAVPRFPASSDPTYVPQVSASPDIDRGALSPYGFSEAQRMTVRVRNVGCSGLSTGTGFAVDSSTLVTNRHVVENSRDIQITTYDGRTLDVTAAAVTTVADIAIVTTETPMSVFARLADHDPVEGDAITVVGFPQGGRLTTVSGVVLGSTSDPIGSATGSVMATTAVVQPGSSGSPVLDADGDVVGVIYAKNESEQSFMVPVSLLRTLLMQDGLLNPEPHECPVVTPSIPQGPNLPQVRPTHGPSAA